MSPTEFSNYIKQRAMQQQLHHSHSGPGNAANLGPIGPVSPSRSMSPNPMASAMMNGPGSSIHDPYFFSSPSNNGALGSNLYTPHHFGGHNSLFEAKSASSHFSSTGFSNNFGNIGSSFMDPNNMYGMPSTGAQPQNNTFGSMNGMPTTPTLTTHTGPSTPNQKPHNGNPLNMNNGSMVTPTSIRLSGNTVNNHIENIGNGGGGVVAAANVAAGGGGGGGANGTNNSNNGGSSKILDGINSFYSSQGSYQHLLVAN